MHTDANIRRNLLKYEGLSTQSWPSVENVRFATICKIILRNPNRNGEEKKCQVIKGKTLHTVYILYVYKLNWPCFLTPFFHESRPPVYFPYGFAIDLPIFNRGV